MEWIVGVWSTIAGLIGLNLCAAGAVAILHAWRSETQSARRTVAAAAAAGFVPTSIIVAIGVSEETWGGSAEEPVIVVLACLMIQLIATVVSLPGALIVGRKLRGSRAEYRVFE
jgi:hypothetical protein